MSIKSVVSDGGLSLGENSHMEIQEFPTGTKEEMKKLFFRVCKQIRGLVLYCHDFIVDDIQLIDCFSEKLKDKDNLPVPEAIYIQGFILYIIKQLQIDCHCGVICFIFLKRLFMNTRVMLLPINWRQFVVIGLLFALNIRVDEYYKLSSSKDEIFMNNFLRVKKIFPLSKADDVLQMENEFHAKLASDWLITPADCIECYAVLCDVDGITPFQPEPVELKHLEMSLTNIKGEYARGDEVKKNIPPHTLNSLRSDNSWKSSDTERMPNSLSSADTKDSKSPPEPTSSSVHGFFSDSLASPASASRTVSTRVVYHPVAREILAVFRNHKKGGFRSSQTSLGISCKFEAVDGWRTVLLDSAISKGNYCWKIQIEYNQRNLNAESSLAIGAAPSDAIDSLEDGLLGSNGSWSLVLQRKGGNVGGYGLFGAKHIGKEKCPYPWYDVLVPDHSVVAIEADADRRLLSFYVGGKKLPFVVSDTIVPFYLGVSGKGQPSFTSVSYLNCKNIICFEKSESYK